MRFDEACRRRFWNKVDIGLPNECWNWTASLNVPDPKIGYGKFNVSNIDGRRLKTFVAHRLAYELAFGEFDQSANVLHRCDNHLCCNPDHLFLGSQLDNVHDMIAKGRAPASPVMQGVEQPGAKLDDDSVRFIRSSQMSCRELGALFSVHPTTVSEVKTFKKWKHVA